MPFGFSASIEANIDDYNVELKKIFVAIAGPLLNIILVFILLEFDEYMAYSNLIIFLFNLIPIFPLDGGRVLKSLLSIFCGRSKASFIINKVSNGVIILLTVVASFAILYLKNISILFILAYLWYLIVTKKLYE